MKKIISIFLCLILALFIVGCTSAIEIQSGMYVADSDVEGPYLQINSDDYSFRFGRGLLYSFDEPGTYEIKNNKIFAVSDSGITFIFEIENEKSVVLREVTDNYYKELINLKFEITIDYANYSLFK